MMNTFGSNSNLKSETDRLTGDILENCEKKIAKMAPYPDAQKMEYNQLLGHLSIEEIGRLQKECEFRLKKDIISQLPVELSLRCLSFCDAQTLGRVMQVSRRWRYLANDEYIWYSLCHQHIDKNCNNCGWTLPVVPDIVRQKSSSSLVESEQKIDNSSTTSATLPPPPVPGIYSGHGGADQNGKGGCSREGRRTWKHVYLERYLIERNWRSGSFKTHQLVSPSSKLPSQSALSDASSFSKGKTVISCQIINGKLVTASDNDLIEVWCLRTLQLALQCRLSSLISISSSTMSKQQIRYCRILSLDTDCQMIYVVFEACVVTNDGTEQRRVDGMALIDKTTGALTNMLECPPGFQARCVRKVCVNVLLLLPREGSVMFIWNFGTSKTAMMPLSGNPYIMDLHIAVDHLLVFFLYEQQHFRMRILNPCTREIVAQANLEYFPELSSRNLHQQQLDPLLTGSRHLKVFRKNVCISISDPGIVKFLDIPTIVKKCRDIYEADPSVPIDPAKVILSAEEVFNECMIYVPSAFGQDRYSRGISALSSNVINGIMSNSMRFALNYNSHILVFNMRFHSKGRNSPFLEFSIPTSSVATDLTAEESSRNLYQGEQIRGGGGKLRAMNDEYLVWSNDQDELFVCDFYGEVNRK